MSMDHGHILVVDDNAINRKLLERALAEQGHAVQTAENGREALETLRLGMSHEFPRVPLSSPEFLELGGTQGNSEVLGGMAGARGNALSTSCCWIF